MVESEHPRSPTPPLSLSPIGVSFAGKVFITDALAAVPRRPPVLFPNNRAGTGEDWGRRWGGRCFAKDGSLHPVK